MKLKSIRNAMKKAGIAIEDDGGQKNGYSIKIRACSSTSEHGYIVLEPLNDPTISEVDHFTRYYPETIKSALRILDAGAY